ncbi:MAG: baseplate J/gp47 family protein [Deltaproteobacteria bacterium]|nr:baseplate J/gp47 family protein [Deltaproteobacteria bacterium]
MTQLTARTQDELLEIVRRTTPPSYYEPLEAHPNSGWEIHRAHAEQAARVSRGIAQMEQDLRYREATGAVRATGTVQFSRSSAAAGVVTIAAGSHVLTDSGLSYLTTAPAVFGAADLGPVEVAIQARRDGYAYNVGAGAITRIGTLAEGSGSDATLAVTNTDPVTGGHPDALQALGWDRGIPRRRGESDDEYRERILAVTDVVTPAAIERLIQRWGVRYSVSPTLLEPWTHAIYADEAYADNDPELWAHSSVTHRGAFTVWLPDVGDLLMPKTSVAARLLDMLDRIKGGGIAIRIVQCGVDPADALTDNYSNDLV